VACFPAGQARLLRELEGVVPAPLGGMGGAQAAERDVFTVTVSQLALDSQRLLVAIERLVPLALVLRGESKPQEGSALEIAVGGLLANLQRCPEAVASNPPAAQPGLDAAPVSERLPLDLSVTQLPADRDRRIEQFERFFVAPLAITE